MFTYNARTELLPEGTKFIEKDIIMFDYSYSGDMVFQVDAVLQTPGFGFVIQEDDGDVQNAENIVLITFSTDNTFKVITKNGGEQVTVIYQAVEGATNIYEDHTTLFFKKHDEALSVYKGIRMDDGHFEEIKLMTYHMPYDMDRYWIGIYSNGGNLVNFASIQTEAPSNWISNVINAGGGRIEWIKDGFTIDEAEFDIEVEAMEVPMKRGRYWFDYETDNPDIKAYIYEAPRRKTDNAGKRSRETILDTMTDEMKNLVTEDGSFYIRQDCTVNIKFKGKWGTVTNICIKNDKRASFIETEYGSTVRPGSRLAFDLTKIVKIRLGGKLYNIPAPDMGEWRGYSIFRRGEQDIGVKDPLRVGNNFLFEFDAVTGIVTLDGQTYAVLNDPSMRLYAFDNVSADISEFIVTLATGEVINVLLQKTVKLTVPATIKSPILVTDENEEPLDLSSSYRKLAIIKPQLELFNAMNRITLQYPPYMGNIDLAIYGINGSSIRKDANRIEDMAEDYIEIPYTIDPAMLIKKIIKLPQDIREQFKYIAVSYNGITDCRYIYTNWEREIYNLKEDQRVYLSAEPLHTNADIYIYGIKDSNCLNEDLLYYIQDDDYETSIDIPAYAYDILTPQDYRINNVNKVIMDDSISSKYKYLIIDYLKKDSYCINERNKNYHIDIATDKAKLNILYDAKDGVVTRTYHVVEMGAIKDGDFVALELKDEDLS